MCLLRNAGGECTFVVFYTICFIKPTLSCFSYVESCLIAKSRILLKCYSELKLELGSEFA